MEDNTENNGPARDLENTCIYIDMSLLFAW